MIGPSHDQRISFCRTRLVLNQSYGRNLGLQSSDYERRRLGTSDFLDGAVSQWRSRTSSGHAREIYAVYCLNSCRWQTDCVREYIRPDRPCRQVVESGHEHLSHISPGYGCIGFEAPVVSSHNVSEHGPLSVRQKPGIVGHVRELHLADTGIAVKASGGPIQPSRHLSSSDCLRGTETIISTSQINAPLGDLLYGILMNTAVIITEQTPKSPGGGGGSVRDCHEPKQKRQSPPKMQRPRPRQRVSASSARRLRKRIQPPPSQTGGGWHGGQDFAACRRNPRP